MALFDITLRGCDDHTTVTVELHRGYEVFLKHVAALTQQASEFSCQPTMTVTEHVEVTE